MNKKGFTLVEILAVIVILGLLAVIAVPSAIGISDNIKKNMYCDKVDMLLTDAERWGEAHRSELKTADVCYKELSIDDLIKAGITKKEENRVGIENPYTGDDMEGKIGVYLKNNRAYAFYIESDSTLKDACNSDDIRVCNDNESERQNGQIVCVKRPSRAC